MDLALCRSLWVAATPHPSFLVAAGEYRWAKVVWCPQRRSLSRTRGGLCGATAPRGGAGHYGVWLGAGHRCLARHGGEWWLAACRRREKATGGEGAGSQWLGRPDQVVRRLVAGGLGATGRRARMQRRVLVAMTFGWWFPPSGVSTSGSFELQRRPTCVVLEETRADQIQHR